MAHWGGFETLYVRLFLLLKNLAEYRPYRINTYHHDILVSPVTHIFNQLRARGTENMVHSKLEITDEGEDYKLLKPIWFWIILGVQGVSIITFNVDGFVQGEIINPPIVIFVVSFYSLITNGLGSEHIW